MEGKKERRPGLWVSGCVVLCCTLRRGWRKFVGVGEAGRLESVDKRGRSRCVGRYVALMSLLSAGVLTYEDCGGHQIKSDQIRSDQMSLARRDGMMELGLL